METLIPQDPSKVEFKEDNVKIIVPRLVLLEMYLYAREATGEISGLGKVERIGTDFRISEVRIFEQECTSSETELNNTELSKFFEEIVEQGGDMTEWRLWWHSHATMGTFFSGTDIECEKNLMECFGDYLISMVVNKKGEFYSRIDMSGSAGYRIINPKCYIEDAVEEERVKAIKKLVFDKVKSPTTGVNTGVIDRTAFAERRKKILDRYGSHHEDAIHPDLYDGYGNPYAWQDHKDFDDARQQLRDRNNREIIGAHAKDMQNASPLEEPYKSGVWDPFNSIWRNPHTLKIWDWKRKVFIVNKKMREMQCDSCYEKSKKVSYAKILEGWLCKKCAKRFSEEVGVEVEPIDEVEDADVITNEKLQNDYESQHDHMC